MSDLTERLAEALEVCNAATAGPWERGEGRYRGNVVYPGGFSFDSIGVAGERQDLTPIFTAQVSNIPREQFEADAEFIAHARTGYPAALKALQAVLDTVGRHPVPSKRDDITGDITAAIDAFKDAVEQAITEHLGATP